ncbi:MAG: hypothetical protein AAGK77_13765, partial [Pseudomonadota bacterium]
MKYTLIPGRSHQASDEETMSVIRSVLTEEIETPKKPTNVGPAQTKAAPKVESAPTRPFVERTPPPAPRRRGTDDLPELSAASDIPQKSRPRARLASNVLRALGQMRRFQPTPRHLAIASAALLFALRPHWFLLGAIFVLLLITSVFLILGSERIWRGVQLWLDRIDARDSARAASLRHALDRFAWRWDSILDLFPDGMVDGLYMPDFQGMQQAE